MVVLLKYQILRHLCAHLQVNNDSSHMQSLLSSSSNKQINKKINLGVFICTDILQPPRYINIRLKKKKQHTEQDALQLISCVKNKQDINICLNMFRPPLEEHMVVKMIASGKESWVLVEAGKKNEFSPFNRFKPL